MTFSNLDDEHSRVLSERDELLAALELLVEVCPCQNDCAADDMTCATNKARAALAKARTEGEDNHLPCCECPEWQEVAK